MANKKTKIAILGTGAFGLALGSLLSNNKALDVMMWTAFANEYIEISSKGTNQKALDNIKLNKELKVTQNIGEALINSDLIVIATPCNVIRSILLKIKESLNSNSKVILVSKGLESKTNMLMTEVYESLNIKGEVAYLAGPTFAKELINNVKSGLTIATKSRELGLLIKEIFKETKIDIELTEDLVGLQLYGALKNIFAILMGSIKEKYEEESTRAYYFTKVYNKINSIVISLGGSEKTKVTYGALGDVFLTCNNESSRNYNYGKLLYIDRKKAEEYVKSQTIEGKSAITALKDRLSDDKEYYLLFAKIEEYFEGQTSFESIINTF